MKFRQPTIKLLSVDDIIRINRQLGEREKVEYTCLDKGRVESALYSAFYPGVYPLTNGGVAEVAGAIAATAFLAINGFELKFPLDPKRNVNAFAEKVLACADGKVTKDEMRKWFDRHKVRIDSHSKS